jgi:hypothetical protein
MEMTFLEHFNPFLSRIVIIYTAYLNVRSSAFSVQGAYTCRPMCFIRLTENSCFVSIQYLSSGLCLDICYMKLVPQMDKQMAGLNYS